MYGVERATRQPPVRHAHAQQIQQTRKIFNYNLDAKYAADDITDDDAIHYKTATRHVWSAISVSKYTLRE